MEPSSLASQLSVSPTGRLHPAHKNTTGRSSDLGLSGPVLARLAEEKSRNNEAAAPTSSIGRAAILFQATRAQLCPASP